MAKKEFSAELTAEFKQKLEMTNVINVEVDQELKKSFIARKGEEAPHEQRNRLYELIYDLYRERGNRRRL